MEESNQSPAKKETEVAEKEVGGGGWGGWGISPFSVFSDLQKAATVAAEEISRNVCTPLIFNQFPLLVHIIFLK